MDSNYNSSINKQNQYSSSSSSSGFDFNLSHHPTIPFNLDATQQQQTTNQQHRLISSSVENHNNHSSMIDFSPLLDQNQFGSSNDIIISENNLNYLRDSSYMNNSTAMKGTSYRAEITIGTKRVRGPTRTDPTTAENDRILLESAKSSDSIENLLKQWEMHSQLLPKGVYYHRDKNAYVATICISRRTMPDSRSLLYRSTMKFDGPARKTADEASNDRTRLTLCKSEDEIIETLRELRGPNGRPPKNTGCLNEPVPPGVYYKANLKIYQAQISVRRKNMRGPPRENLSEALDDRRRLMDAKLQGRADDEVDILKLEYKDQMMLKENSQRLSPISSELILNDNSMMKRKGRPRGSVSLGKKPMLNNNNNNNNNIDCRNNRKSNLNSNDEILLLNENINLPRGVVMTKTRHSKSQPIDFSLYSSQDEAFHMHLNNSSRNISSMNSHHHLSFIDPISNSLLPNILLDNNFSSDPFSLNPQPHTYPLPTYNQAPTPTHTHPSQDLNNQTDDLFILKN